MRRRTKTTASPERANRRSHQRLVSSLRRPAKAKLRFWFKKIEADIPPHPKPSHKYALLVGYLQALDDLDDIEAANGELSGG